MATPYYLAFTDEAQAISVLYTPVEVSGTKDVEYTQYLVEGTPDEDGDIEHYWTETLAEGDVILETKVGTTTVKDPDTTVIELVPKYANIDVLGTVYLPAPEPTPEDYVPVPYPAPNYGVNVLVLDSENATPLTPYAVDPTLPQRVWAI
jgi:hypothetical protein